MAQLAVAVGVSLALSLYLFRGGKLEDRSPAHFGAYYGRGAETSSQNSEPGGRFASAERQMSAENATKMQNHPVAPTSAVA